MVCTTITITSTVTITITITITIPITTTITLTIIITIAWVQGLGLLKLGTLRDPRDIPASPSFKDFVGTCSINAHHIMSYLLLRRRLPRWPLLTFVLSCPLLVTDGIDSCSFIGGILCLGLRA